MSAKPSSPSLVVKLSLASDLLSQFATDDAAITKPSRKNSSSSTSTPAAPVAEASVSNDAPDGSSVPAVTNDTASVDNASNAPQTNGTKKKGIPGPKPGTKRGAGFAADGMPKPRGKPGPKKKPRISDIKNDAIVNGPFAAPAPVSTQKLGPKANQGAINAGLRALDRSGKPCRKWEKKGFQLKSFTGVNWTVPTWRTPKKSAVDENGDVKSDTTGSSETAKVNESSALASEKSSSGGNLGTPNRSGFQQGNVPSSPMAGMTPA
ncbi:hypothetical protein K490DRAFT_62588 [Saccharata proteae CBS 121410]|uniref:DUF1711-domain-containing protein n=1 Tax=Saccharata proteae CBS 121410 TaxID=1314787 RepID=A0A9P4I145_9PEZI|nr:hypothetical protein K490DRAFT_62588 [Saccharata proteae CBS 121410]